MTNFTEHKKHQLQEEVELSVIAPVFNEEESLREFIENLSAELLALSITYEIILINDGSTDNSQKILEESSKKFTNIKVIEFVKNFGQTAAIMAGIDNAVGNIIITIDSDLQNDPSDIAELIMKINQGYDVVSGWRKDRKDSKIKRNFVSRVANKLISRVSGVKLHDFGCTLKAYRKEVLSYSRLYGEMHRFIPIYASWSGAKVTEIPVKHHPRKYGTSKYGLERIFKVILDLILVKFMSKFMHKPIYFFGGFAITSILISLLLTVYMIFLKYIYDVSFILTPLPVIIIMFTLIGIISILLGILAELNVRTYFESQKKFTYIIKNAE